MFFGHLQKFSKKTQRKMQKGVDKRGEMMYTVKVAARETERRLSVIEN